MNDPSYAIGADFPLSEASGSLSTSRHCLILFIFHCRSALEKKE